MKIFEPIKINNVEIKNRLVVSAMVTNYCNEDGLANEKFIKYHERKAKGGFGLIIPENYAITKTAGGFKRIPGLWCDEQIESHKKFVDIIHKTDAKIFCQIYHAGRQTTSAITGVQCVAPSAIPDPTMNEIPHELTIEEIKDLVEKFGEAALRAKKAGFDGVEIHGAHGYLIGQFNSPFSNKRTDIYGGTIQNRCRFMIEIIQKVKEICGQDFPVQLRISANEFVNGGLEIEDTKVIAMLAEKAGADSIHVSQGVDSIHVSQGVYASAQFIIPPSSVSHGAFVDNAAEIKKVVNIPVIAVGRINDPLLAESILKSGKADLCTMARASLADPEMPNKAKEGRFDEIITCIGCLQGCNGEEMKGNCIRCLVNPLTGMEDEYKILPANPAKNIVIVGGGVTGCETAIVAAQRGHRVTIIEKTDKLGGQWLTAAVPVGKGDFTTFTAWQKTMIEKLGIKVVYNTEANREIIESYSPDVIVLTYGSIPAIPPVEGLKEYGVLADSILKGEKSFGKKVVVIGGGLVGAETADHIAAHGGKDISIIEMLPEIVPDGEESAIYFMNKRFKEAGIHVYTSSKVLKVSKNEVIFSKNNETINLKDVDTIVIATGRKIDSSLADSLKDVKYQVITAGDSKNVKQGYIDIREGYEVGLNI